MVLLSSIKHPSDLATHQRALLSIRQNYNILLTRFALELDAGSGLDYDLNHFSGLYDRDRSNSALEARSLDDDILNSSW